MAQASANLKKDYFDNVYKNSATEAFSWSTPNYGLRMNSEGTAFTSQPSNAYITSFYDSWLNNLKYLWTGKTVDVAYNDLFKTVQDFYALKLGREWSMMFADGNVHGIRMDGPNQFGGYSITAYEKGGYADRPSIFGEAGGEWAVPDTTNPNNENFLRSVGMDKVLGKVSGGNDKEIISELKQQNRLLIELVAATREGKIISAVFDEREAGNAIGRQLDKGNRGLVKGVRAAVRQ
jgi:hypothetical protein